jgi:hypothetical protein
LRQNPKLRARLQVHGKARVKSSKLSEVPHRSENPSITHVMVGRCQCPVAVAPLPLPPSPSLFLPSSLCFWTPLLCQYRAGCQNSSPQAPNIQALLPQSRKPDRRKLLQAHRKPCPKSPRKPPGHPRTNRCPLFLLDCPASCANPLVSLGRESSCGPRLSSSSIGAGFNFALGPYQTVRIRARGRIHFPGCRYVRYSYFFIA